jgi:Uma2 family endonuclease
MITPVPRPVQKPATYEDLMKVPDHLVAEIIDGELFTSPRPAMRHARASSALGGKLTPPFDFGDGGPGGWWIIFEPELHLGRDILVPDLAGWRRERMPVYPDAAYCELPPDWVCEVVSPSTGRLDRVLKMPKYAINGVAHLWLIDPMLKTLEVYRLENARWLLLASHGEDEIVRAEPFDAVDLPLATLWT